MFILGNLWETASLLGFCIFLFFVPRIVHAVVRRMIPQEERNRKKVEWILSVAVWMMAGSVVFAWVTNKNYQQALQTINPTVRRIEGNDRERVAAELRQLDTPPPIGIATGYQPAEMGVLAEDILLVLRDAGWEVTGDKVNYLPIQQGRPTFGITVWLYGPKTEESAVFYVAGSDAASKLNDAFQGLGFQSRMSLTQEIPEGTILIEVAPIRPRGSS